MSSQQPPPPYMAQDQGQPPAPQPQPQAPVYMQQPNSGAVGYYPQAQPGMPQMVVVS